MLEERFNKNRPVLDVLRSRNLPAILYFYSLIGICVAGHRNLVSNPHTANFDDT